MNNNSPKKSGLPWWLVILTFAMGLWPIALVLLIIRLAQESGALTDANTRRYREEAARYAREAKQDISNAARTVRSDLHNASQTKTQSAQNPQNTQRASGPQSTVRRTPTVDPRAAERKARRAKIKNGRLFTSLGAVLSIFGLLGTAGLIPDVFQGDPDLLSALFVTSLMTGGGIAMFVWGRFKKGQSKRFNRYLSLIGDLNEVPIDTLSKAMPASPSAVYTALENMIDAGILGENAYLDYAREMLILDGSGVRSAQKEPEQQPRTAPETDIGAENAVLLEIRAVNASIQNQELSRKIERVEYITERIFEFQREHPEKSGELKKFLNYYLPTTLKILRHYAEMERQGVQGENINYTKARVEEMMDMVVEGFERQLDKLFAGDMMDIAADITVMEQMMEGDGLTGNSSDFGAGGGAAGGV